MYVIALIGIGLVFHGFIMLAFAAFRARASWGFAVLLIPFAQLFFPIYYWDQARKPFMTFTFGLSLWLGTAVVFGQGPLDEYWLSKVSPAHSSENLANSRTEQPLSLQERAQMLVNRAKSFVTHPLQSRNAQRFVATESPNFVGENVRVTLRNGTIRHGRIISVRNDLIKFQNMIGRKAIGSMSFELTYDEIKLLEVD